MDTRIRKITIAKGYLSEDRVMNYVVGNDAYGDYKIVEIDKDLNDSIIIRIKNSENELIDWKNFNSSVAMIVEYSLTYDEEVNI